MHITVTKPLHRNYLNESSSTLSTFMSKIKTLRGREVTVQGHSNRKEVDVGLKSRQYDSNLLKLWQLF